MPYSAGLSRCCCLLALQTELWSRGDGGWFESGHSRNALMLLAVLTEHCKRQQHQQPRPRCSHCWPLHCWSGRVAPGLTASTRRRRRSRALALSSQRRGQAMHLCARQPNSLQKRGVKFGRPHKDEEKCNNLLVTFQLRRGSRVTHGWSFQPLARLVVELSADPDCCFTAGCPAQAGGPKPASISRCVVPVVHATGQLC